MDKSIIVLVHPFIVGQYICIYENGECKERITVDFEDIPKKVFELAKLHGINKICLKGNKHFTTKINENICKFEKYNKDDFEIIIK